MPGAANANWPKLVKPWNAMLEYNNVLDQALAEHNPSLIALFAFNLAKGFQYLFRALRRECGDAGEKEFRLQLSALTAHVIASAMGLLGIPGAGKDVGRQGEATVYLSRNQAMGSAPHRSFSSPSIQKIIPQNILIIG